MVAERAGESFVRAVVRIQREAEDIGRACRERLRGLAEPAGTHIAHHRKPGGRGKRPHQMEARDAGNAGDSSSVSGSARWLSMYQSAFWAGFMTDSFPAKQPHYDADAHALHLTVLALRFLPLTMYSQTRLEGTMLITNVRAHHIRIPYDAGVASFRQGAVCHLGAGNRHGRGLHRCRHHRLGRCLCLCLPADNIHRHRGNDRAAGAAAWRSPMRPAFPPSWNRSSATCICSAATASPCSRYRRSISRCGTLPPKRRACRCIG